MRGDCVTDIHTGLELVVCHDFANRGDGSDLLFPPVEATLSEAEQHLKHTTRPRLPGCGRRVKPKAYQE